MATISERLRMPYGHSENETTGERTPLFSPVSTEDADTIDALVAAYARAWS